jgi:hypothetical protein
MRALLASLLLLVQAGPARPQEIGIVTGVIRSSEGTPTPGVRVFARSTASVSEGQTVLEAQTETDATGRYLLEIVPGQYNIGAGFLDAPTWYPATADIKTARPVNVSANITVSLDITTSSINGNIQVLILNAADGAPMKGVTVGLTGTPARALQHGQSAASVLLSARSVSQQTDASGNTAFRNLVAGIYRIQPRFSGYVAPDTLVVTIDQGQTSHAIQIKLTPSAIIFGR